MHCSVSSAVQGLRWNYKTPPQGSGPACPGQHSAALLPHDGRLRAALEERKAMGRKEGKVVQELVMPTLDSHMGAAAKAVSGARALRG